jgi:hypothetical protein
MITLAPLTIAPAGSLTVPLMLPVPTVVWAQLATENINASNATAIDEID